jgi:hypothetical protein
MAATTYQIFTAADLQPGDTRTFYWKNVPEGKAYAIDVEPHPQAAAGWLGTVVVEITRYGRRKRVSGPHGRPTSARDDVFAAVKNVGDQVADYIVFLTVFS